MANIMDYLDWRGDLTFDEGTVNEVDNLVFSYLAYVDFDDIVKGLDSDEKITLEEANKAYWEKHTEEEIKERKVLTKDSVYLLKKMAGTERFKNLTLSKYVNIVDDEISKQFSAITIGIGEDITFIAFRGTDSTMTGWREDFNMSFQTVPAQKEAVNYINAVGKKAVEAAENAKIYVGGHSKGGNLAVFSAMNAAPEVKSKLVKIYNNDGPGMIGFALSNDSYKEIKDRVETYVPKSSIVGLLLEHADDYKIVDSTEKGLLQHNPTSWVIKGGHFELVDSPTIEGLIADTATRAWVESMDFMQREEFTNALFGALDAAGIHTTQDFTRDRWNKVINIMKALKDNPDDIDKILSAGRTIVGGAARAMFRLFDDFIGPDNK